MTETIAIASIDTADRLRALDPDWVALLAEEIAVNGLDEPIRVVARGNGYKLVQGARRLAAHQLLGLDEIEARIEPEEALADEAAVRLAEIKGNMLRGDLTALDRAVYVAAWCDLYRQTHEAPKRGPKKAVPASDEATMELSTNLVLNWTEAAQRALKISRMAVFRALKIASIDRDITGRLALLPVADKQSDLLALADLPPARQNAVVAMLAAEPAQAQSINEALALLDSVPQPKLVPVYERLYQKFSTLKPAEQERFFDLNSSAIELWIAKRAASSRKSAA